MTRTSFSTATSGSNRPSSGRDDAEGETNGDESGVFVVPGWYESATADDFLWLS